MTGTGAGFCLMASFGTGSTKFPFLYRNSVNIYNRKRQADTFALI